MSLAAVGANLPGNASGSPALTCARRVYGWPTPTQFDRKAQANGEIFTQPVYDKGRALEFLRTYN